MDAALRHAIARIDIVQGERSIGHGTGCLVASDLVLTAMHVVANRATPQLTLLPGTIVLTFPTHRTEATLVEGRWDPRSDWALLRCVTTPPGVRPVPLADGVSDGAEWETFGFPDANSRDGLAQLGTIENAAGSFEGVPAYQLFSRQAAAGVGAPVKGLSGGPVIVDGALVGVFRASLMREGQFNVAGTLYGCPVETILDRCEDLLPIPDPCRGLPGLPRRPLPAVPFRFLNRFTADDAEIFFGRNREIRELYDRVTSDDGAPVVLLYGQSGAGKSSFLDAGLLPRLGAAYSSVYLRRDRARGLLGTLTDALALALPAVSAAHASVAPAEALRMAWLGTETAAGRPLVVVLDQVEEAFTLPSEDEHELEAFIDTLPMLLNAPTAPKGRLVLGFRKEWFAEIQKQLDTRGIEYSKVFLEALGADAVAEVVGGLRHTKRLRERYGLEVEPSLAGAMARDLTADRDSPVAPTLQVLLSRMWREATEASHSAPRFTSALYQRITSEGFLLIDFLDQQLTTLAAAAEAGGSRVDVVESGLALDVLRFHVSRMGTAEERSAQELVDEYQRAEDVAWLVGELKRLYLLSEPAGDSRQAAAASRLSHDTLAQAVRVRFDESMRLGQRARRVIEGRANEWIGGRTGTPLDVRDLTLAEQGLTGMRALHPDEERLLEGSRAARREASVAAMKRRAAARVAVAAVAVAAAVAGWLGLENAREGRWRDMLTLNARIPTILLVEPVGGLVAAIDAVDRSLDLNDEEVLPAIQTNLARALDEARERISWPLEDEANAVAFSSDGRIAAGTTTGIVRVFRLDGGTTLPPIQAAGRGVPVSGVAFSGDGEFLAAALGRQGISVWDRKGQPLASRSLPDQPFGMATAVRFTPDGHTLIAAFVVADERSMLYVCDLDRAEARTLAIDTMDPVASMATARTSSGMLLIATAGGDVRIWNGADGRLMLGGPLKFGEASIAVVDLIVAPDTVDHAHPGTVLVAGGASDGTVVIWDITHNPPPGLPTSVGSSGKSTASVAFGHQGRVVFAGGIDGFVRAFNLKGEGVMPAFTSGGNAVVGALAASPDGTSVAAAGDDLDGRYLRVIDMVGTEVHAPLQRPASAERGGLSRVNAVAFEPDRTELLVAGLGRTLDRWTIDVPRGSAWSRATLAQIDSGQDETTAMAVGPSSGFKILAGGTLQFFDRDWHLTANMPLRSPVSALRVSEDGATAVAGDMAGTVTIWDTAARRVTHTIAAHTGQVWSVAFDPSGDRFATGGVDKTIRVWRRDGTAMWNVPTGAEVTALAFHPDGSLFAGTDRGVVEQYDLDDRHVMSSIPVVRNEMIRSLLVHPSGETVYVASRVGVRLLDVRTSALLDLKVRGHDLVVQSIALSADGRLLAGVNEEGNVMVWRADWREWLSEACERLRNHPIFRDIDRRTEPPSPFEREGVVNHRAAFEACTRRVWNSSSR